MNEKVVRRKKYEIITKANRWIAKLKPTQAKTLKKKGYKVIKW